MHSTSAPHRFPWSLFNDTFISKMISATLLHDAGLGLACPAYKTVKTPLCMACLCANLLNKQMHHGAQR